MNGLNKQFINVIGIVVVAVLIAGVALIALPMWSQSQATDASTRTVAQTNAMYQAQIDQLSAAEERIEQIDAHIAGMRTEIAGFSQLDDVFKIIIDAAETHELILDRVTASDPEPFTPRGTGVSEASATTGDEGSGSAAAPASDPPSGQRQIAVTIEVPVPDAVTAMAFVDDLRVGPRLLLPIDVSLSASNSKLTVTLLTFIRTED